MARSFVGISATDEAGNVQILNLKVVRDTVAPKLTLVAPEGMDILTNRRTLEISGYTDEPTSVKVASTDARGQLQGSLVSTVAVGIPVKYWFEYTLELNTDANTHAVTVYAYDGAGNFDQSPFTYTARVRDPYLALNNFPQKVTEPFLWVNGSTDVGITSVRINGQEVPVVDQGFSVGWHLPVKEGTYTVTVSARDEAGNTNTLVAVVEVDVPAESVVVDAQSGGLGTAAVSMIAAGLLGVAMVVLLFAFSGRRPEEQGHPVPRFPGGLAPPGFPFSPSFSVRSAPWWGATLRAPGA